MEVRQGYKRTEVGVIPEDWEVKRLGEIGLFSKGKGIRKDDVAADGIPCIRYGEIYTRYNDYIRDFCSFIPRHIAVLSQRIQKGDLLFAGSGETAEEIGKCVAFLGDEEAYAGGDIIVFSPKDQDSMCLGYMMNLSFVAQQKARLGQGDAVVHINSRGLGELKLRLPSLTEQGTIAKVLGDADALIQSLEKLIAKKRDIKRGAMQELLRPKDGWEGNDYNGVIFDSVFMKKNSKNHQIQTSDYQSSGRYAVIDQGKSDIIAYSDKRDMVFRCSDKGTIVFGDHTRVLKFVDFDFVVGADGTQLLETKDGYSTKYMFYVLQTREIPNTGYNRHYKFLKEMNFVVPIEAEQTRIATILSDMDAEIAALETKLDKYKQIKRGMMQELLTGNIRLVDGGN